MIMAVKFR